MGTCGIEGCDPAMLVKSRLAVHGTDTLQHWQAVHGFSALLFIYTTSACKLIEEPDEETEGSKCGGNLACGAM